jgi:hypothetical protein
VFCGYEADEFPPEHWIPDWLSRELFPKYAKGGVVHSINGEETHIADVFEMTVQHVCQKCNETWMSTIESRAKKHVFPMIVADYSARITKQAIEHVARWSYLKIISLELGRPGDHLPTHPPAVYAAFRQTRKPPYPNVSLAIGAREAVPRSRPDFVSFVSQSFQAPWGPGGSRVDFYRTTLVIGHLVIDAVGMASPNHRPNFEYADGLQVVWPMIVEGGTLTWPPDKRFRGIENGVLV